MGDTSGFSLTKWATLPYKMGDISLQNGRYFLTKWAILPENRLFFLSPHAGGRL
jgi:hypothetical protein